jgi:carbonic anhydrase/acetyltransferase-like protein (isoleucine patch superfamily)
MTTESMGPDPQSEQRYVASSAVLMGEVQLGAGAVVAQGAVIRAKRGPVRVDSHSAILENSVVVGTSEMPVMIGRSTAFGHRCVVIAARVGDHCEIGNGTVIMPGATLGERVFLGEGTTVPAGMTLPSDVVAVGRPAHIIRSANDADIARLTVLRGGDLTLPTSSLAPVSPQERTLPMGQLFPYRGTMPTIAATALLFPTAEITGDVVIGDRTIIGSGVKIIGDSHGPVRIGNDVQILENTVLHLLPDNQLVIDDGAVIGPGAMIHGCHIGSGAIVEPGAIVCDHSVVGARSIVRAGAVVKQRSSFADNSDIDGFPATRTGPAGEVRVPPWAFSADDDLSLSGARPVES